MKPTPTMNPTPRNTFMKSTPDIVLYEGQGFKSLSHQLTLFLISYSNLGKTSGRKVSPDCLFCPNLAPKTGEKFSPVRPLMIMSDRISLHQLVAVRPPNICLSIDDNLTIWPDILAPIGGSCLSVQQISVSASVTIWLGTILALICSAHLFCRFASRWVFAVVSLFLPLAAPLLDSGYPVSIQFQLINIRIGYLVNRNLLQLRHK